MSRRSNALTSRGSAATRTGWSGRRPPARDLLEDERSSPFCAATATCASSVVNCSGPRSGWTTTDGQADGCDAGLDHERRLLAERGGVVETPSAAEERLGHRGGGGGRGAREREREQAEGGVSSGIKEEPLRPRRDAADARKARTAVPGRRGARRTGDRCSTA